MKQNLNPSIAPIACIQRSTLERNLLRSTDGLIIKKFTYKKIVTRLASMLWYATNFAHVSRRHCFILSLCWFWCSKLEWDRSSIRSWTFFPQAKLYPGFSSFKVRLLVTDLVAKPHVLNMMQLNGYFGCHFCTAEGITTGRAHVYYPYNQSGSTRETSLHSRYV